VQTQHTRAPDDALQARRSARGSRSDVSAELCAPPLPKTTANALTPHFSLPRVTPAGSRHINGRTRLRTGEQGKPIGQRDSSRVRLCSSVACGTWAVRRTCLPCSPLVRATRIVGLLGAQQRTFPACRAAACGGQAMDSWANSAKSPVATRAVAQGFPAHPAVLATGVQTQSSCVLAAFASPVAQTRGFQLTHFPAVALLPLFAPQASSPAMTESRQRGWAIFRSLTAPPSTPSVVASSSQTAPQRGRWDVFRRVMASQPAAPSNSPPADAADDGVGAVEEEAGSGEPVDAAARYSFLRGNSSNEDLLAADLRNIPPVLKEYEAQALTGASCPHCQQALSQCSGLTQPLLTRLLNKRYKQQWLRTAEDIVLFVRQHGPVDIDDPSGLITLEPGMCVCFQKLRRVLAIRNSMFKRIKKMLRAPIEGASPWTGEVHTTGNTAAHKKHLVHSFLEETLISDLSENPTHVGAPRQMSPVCLTEVHQKFEQHENVLVDYSYFCKSFKQWLRETNTSIRKTKTVEGVCADCLEYEAGIATAKAQHDHVAEKRCKAAREAHGKDMMAQKKAYYGACMVA